MFGRRLDWRDYRQDILLFAELLHDPHWIPSKHSRQFLLDVQRGYHRVGLSGAKDAWMALACACLWRACCFPDQIQFVMAGTTKSGQSWIRFLKSVASECADSVREHLLFSEDEDSVIVRGAQTPSIAILSPGHLAGVSTIVNARPTSLVLPDFDRVPAAWFPKLKHLIGTAKDQWLVVAPVRR